MAKTVTTLADFDMPAAVPAAKGTASSPRGSKRDVPTVPLQLRIPEDAAKAIKHAAIDKGMTVSDYMLACWQSYMQNAKQ